MSVQKLIYLQRFYPRITGESLRVKQEEGLLDGMSTVPVSLSGKLIINRHTCHPRKCLDLKVPGMLAEMFCI